MRFSLRSRRTRGHAFCRMAFFAAVVSFALCPGVTLASVITFNLDTPYTNAITPSGTAPWVRVTVADVDDVVPHQVTVAIDANFQSTSEFLGKDGVFLNLDPHLTFSRLTIVQSSGPQATVSLAEDGEKAGANTKFDLLFGFNAQSGRLAGHGEAIFELSSTDPSFGASSFNFPSSGGSNGNFYASAHVQGIGRQGNSSFLGGGSPPVGPTGSVVPEPSTLVLTLVGLGAVGAARGLRRRA
jgi:hypothetical protein